MARSLTNGLARAAIRFKPASFAGTFVALMMAALIVSACGILLESGVRAAAPPQRYADAPVVAAAEQKAHYEAGGDQEGTLLPDTARLDARLVAKVSRAPGVAAAIPDLSYPLRTAAGTVTAHGWGSTAFTGTKLASGAAPRAGDEVVLDAATARAARLTVGSHTTVTSADGAHRVRVTGIAAPHARAAVNAPTAWLTDQRADALSGHPGKVDAIAVLPEPGTSTGDLADQVERAVAGKAKVHTGDDRGGVEEPGVAGAQDVLVGVGGSFGGIAALVAIFTTAGTVALCVSQRSREFALLRAIGATPRQLRRSVATEALLVAPLAGALGCLPGIALAHWWFDQLRDKGAIPDGVELQVTWLPLLCAVGAGLLAAVCAGLLAARRPAKIKPGQALSEAAVERSNPGVIRTVIGAGALVGAIALAGVAAEESGDDAANLALGVVMLFMLAVSLLGPIIARLCAWLIGLPLRLGGPAAHLAAANTRANSRRLASALTPIVLAMAFSSTLVFLHTSQAQAASDQRRAGVVADHVISSPDGLPAGTAARAARTPGVATAVGLLRTGALVQTGSGENRMLLNVPTQGISGTGSQLRAVQDLDLRSGDQAAIGRPGTVAVDHLLADAAGVEVGERLRIVLPDGTVSRPEVVATYGRGLGLAQLTLARSTLAPHVTSAFDSDVLVKRAPGGDPAKVAAALAPLGAVTDPDGYAAAQDKDSELNAWANTTMAAVLGGFAAVAAANTLVMTVLDRRRELGMLRLVGSTRRQILGMVRWEALLVGGAGVAIGTAIALITLNPMTHGITGEAPHIPAGLYASIAGAAVLLGLLSTTLPARLALRQTALSGASQRQ